MLPAENGTVLMDEGRRSYWSQALRQAGGMMHRTLRLADMLPMLVAPSSTEIWFSPLAKVGAK